MTRGVNALWTLVALAVAALTAAGALVLLGAARGPRPAFLNTPRAAASVWPARPPKRAADTIEIAGSGSNLPLTRLLVEDYLARDLDARVAVHASIGSGGAVQAVRDGAIDVGLISRPLTVDEARLGLTVTPYARVAVVVAANRSVPDDCTTSRDLVEMVTGIRTRWRDGSRVVVLQRERGDSSFLAMSRLVPDLAARNDAAYRERRWRVFYDDDSMQQALVATEGAAGIFDLGAIVAQRLPLRVLCVDGVAPSAEAVVSGRYPFWKDLAFVTAGPLEDRVRAFVEYVLSSEGRVRIAAAGYAPLPLDAAAPLPPPAPLHDPAGGGGAP